MVSNTSAGDTNDQPTLNSNSVNAVSPNSLLSNGEWPFDTAELFKIGFRFFKDNESKAFYPSYDQRNSFVAYSLQVKHGNFNPNKAKPLGALDFIGHDRRTAWAALNDMSKTDAQLNFLKLLDNICPLFRPFVMAIKCDLDEKERRNKELEEMERIKLLELEESEIRKANEEARLKEEAKRKKYEEQKRIIQEILNRQTIHQFSSYAKQQYPENIELQEQLIAQLQEQHFQQYMQQMMEQSNDINETNGIMIDTCDLNNSGDAQQNLAKNVETFILQNSTIEDNPESATIDDTLDDEEDDDSEEEEEEEADECVIRSISNASMWTRKDIVTFKDSIRAEGSDGMLKVGHGEIATIRVPTHENGNCIFWEFATDSYDIGFGLLFEWTSNPDNQVSIHISESDEEEDEDEEEHEAIANDIEKGATSGLELKTTKQNESQLPISVIIPIYRRDSHEEVFAGSHSYPGKGVYLLKFDNSYSLWRSKNLYYRVYYTKET